MRAAAAVHDGKRMKYLVLTMRRPEFDVERVPAHYQFLDGLRADGVLEQAGPFTDRSGGAYILEAADLNDAQRIAEQDPLHTFGCSTVTVHEWDAK
jgi:uncharacterized protein YciI